MLFNSLDYLLFLAVALGLFWMLWSRPTVRLAVLFALSCVFYMAWHPAYIVLILGSAALDFAAGLGIGSATGTLQRRGWLALSLLGNLGLLCLFKYLPAVPTALLQAGFEQVRSVLAGGAEMLPWGSEALVSVGRFVPKTVGTVLLPVGISFYTFQTLSYTIDVYRGRFEPTRDFVRFACFVMFFPQLVAGPIVRATELLPQLKRPPALGVGGASQGLFWIGVGLFKKVVIADYLSVNLVDRVFGNPSLYSSAEVVVALYGFTMQMYCDFSGYTDIARGSARLMGFELPPNFDRPYQAKNPAEFWRRWHMTLSLWLRDYLYYPLGGSRVPAVRAYFNLAVTMFAIGIWHGSGMTFVWYALVQTVAMVGHRWFHRRVGGFEVPILWLRRVVHGGSVFLCLQFVVFSRLLFRAESMGNAQEVWARLMAGRFSLSQISFTLGTMLVLCFSAHMLPRPWFERVERGFVRWPWWAQGTALAGAGAVMGMVCTSEVVPYIYFQF